MTAAASLHRLILQQALQNYSNNNVSVVEKMKQASDSSPKPDESVSLRTEIIDSAYLLSIFKHQQTVNKTNALPMVIPNSQPLFPSQVLTKPAFRYNSVLTKPCPISAESGRRHFKDVYYKNNSKKQRRNGNNKIIARPLAMPPKLPSVQAGQVVKCPAGAALNINPTLFR